MSMPSLPPGTMRREPQGSLGNRVLATSLAAPIPVVLSLVFFGLRWTIVLAVAAMALLLMVAKDSLLAALRWHRPELQMASMPYALGSTPTVIYRRKPKRVTDIAACTVRCTMMCEERVTYTQGTDTRTDTRRVYESESVGAGQGTADGLVAELELTISAHRGAPSFKLPNNEVRWIAEITIDGPRLPRDSHRFVIDVAAVVDPSHRAGVQDT